MILCQVNVRFDPFYGFDLSIEDVDPKYTLGDLAAKLARIRQGLVKDGPYQRNKAMLPQTNLLVAYCVC